MSDTEQSASAAPAPAPGPSASQSVSANTRNKDKIHLKPQTFKGNRSAAEAWLNSIVDIIDEYPNVLTTENEKSQYFLSHIDHDEKETAEWVTAQRISTITWNEDGTRTKTPLNYEKLLTAFRKSWVDTKLKEKAIIEISTIVQGNTPWDTFTTKFRTLALQSGMEDAALIVNFRRAAKPAIINKALGVRPTPSTLEGWIEIAHSFQTEWENQQRLYPTKVTPRKPTPAVQGRQATFGNYQRPNNQGTYPKPLTPEERERCIRENLCFRCREKGHGTRSCPKYAPRVQARRAEPEVTIDEQVFEEED
jgi:hypothetical protein